MDAIPGKTGYHEVQASGFVLTEAGYAPHAERPWHVHDMAEFCFMLDGSLTETVGRQHLTCRRFDVTFKPAGESHECRVGGTGARYLAVGVPALRLEGDRAIERALSAPMHFVNSTLLDLGLRICRELEQPDDLTGLVLEGIALELMVHASRANRLARLSGRPAWVETARDILHDSFTTPLGLRRLAGEVGIHPAHLTTVFRQQFGCSVGEYIRSLRINYARQLMAGSDRSLAEVAVTAGFADQSHFTRLFKRHTGITPARYRRTPWTPRSG